MKWLLRAVVTGLLLTSIGGAVVAQTEPPPPYAGMKNPFSWSDAVAQAAGKPLYQQHCAACHGANGSGIAQFDFSKPAYSASMEAKPDFYFWAVSEGRINKGMPGYKSSLSEQQRWQLLTYMHSMSSAAPAATIPPSPPAITSGSIILTVAPETKTGQELTIAAALRDEQDHPVSGAEVKFSLAEDFFAKADMEIGTAVTGKDGTATVTFKPQRPGETKLTVSSGTVAASQSIDIQDSGEVFYVTEAGIRVPSAGPQVFVGPQSARELNDMGEAPNIALRLPGGALSWLWLYVGVLALVWGIYLAAVFQVLRISSVREAAVNGSRLVPAVSLIIIVGLGLLMVFMVLTGPFSHFHLMP